MLRYDKHPNLDFFVADFWAWPVKDDQHTMEHPFFSLAKGCDTAIRRYEHQGNIVTVTPSVLGMPSIWDKDILIYCTSQLIAGMRAGREPHKTVRITMYDFLVSTNRCTGKRGYELVHLALQKLEGVRIMTNIQTGGIRIREGFGLIDKWRIIERSPTNNRMISLEITLSDWLYNAILSHEVLTLHRDYFRLDGGLERRLYELCRKHTGHQDKWAIHLPLLHIKSGARSDLKWFRFALQKLAAKDELPEYRLTYSQKTDKLTAYPKTHKGGLRQLKDVLGL